MADVNDVSGMDRKLERQWRLLEDADISEVDRAAIADFVDHRREIEECARSTRRTDLSNLRCASERADLPLTEMNLADVRRLFDMLTTPRDDGGYGLDPSGSGMFDYKRALRVFFDWLDEDPEHGAFPFGDRIELPSRDVQGAASKDEMLTPDEVEAMKTTARYARDRALIDLVADVCPRVTLLLGLRVGDIDLEGAEPSFTPNDQVVDGHKGVDDEPIPILYSRAELRTWIRHNHPDPRDHVPLWPVLVGYDEDNPQQCALGDDQFRDMLEDCAERAGIDKPAKPHHFRRTALTRMSNSDRLTPQEIQHIAGWADQRMLEVYDYTTAEERNSGIHQSLGFSDGRDDERPTVDVITCPNCRSQVSSATNYCPQCGDAVDDEVRAELEATQAEIDERKITADDPQEAVLWEQLGKKLGMEPAVLRDRWDGDAHGEPS